MSLDYWTDDPEFDEEIYFLEEDRMDWDERIDRLRDNLSLDDWDYKEDWK